MKFTISIILTIFVFWCSFSQDIEVAKVNKDMFLITLDTVLFKQEIMKKFISDTSTVSFTKIKVGKSTTIVEQEKDYYYIRLIDPVRHLSVSRILKRKRDKLYLVNNRDTIEKIYLFCLGNSDCEPNVFVFEGKLSWGCGDKLQCFLNPDKMLCKIYKMIETN